MIVSKIMEYLKKERKHSEYLYGGDSYALHSYDAIRARIFEEIEKEIEKIILSESTISVDKTI
jgi:hypothetical protein